MTVYETRVSGVVWCARVALGIHPFILPSRRCNAQSIRCLRVVSRCACPPADASMMRIIKEDGKAERTGRTKAHAVVKDFTRGLSGSHDPLPAYLVNKLVSCQAILLLLLSLLLSKLLVASRREDIVASLVRVER